MQMCRPPPTPFSTATQSKIAPLSSLALISREIPTVLSEVLFFPTPVLSLVDGLIKEIELPCKENGWSCTYNNSLFLCEIRLSVVEI